MLALLPNIDAERLIITVIVLVLSLTLHELAHGRTALAFGDPTAKLMGRITLNPLRHLDLIGSLAFFFVGFGWAKPVPVNYANLRPQRLGDIMVSLAGPLANLGLAVVFGLLLRFLADYDPLLDRLNIPNLHRYWVRFLAFALQANLLLFMFNLIPLFPLDGHHIQREVLPARWRGPYMEWQMRYGRWALLAIVFVPQYLNGVPDLLGLLYQYVGEPIAGALIGF